MALGQAVQRLAGQVLLSDLPLEPTLWNGVVPWPSFFDDAAIQSISPAQSVHRRWSTPDECQRALNTGSSAL